MAGKGGGKVNKGQFQTCGKLKKSKQKRMNWAGQGWGRGGERHTMRYQGWDGPRGKNWRVRSIQKNLGESTKAALF